MQRYARMPTLDVWYARTGADGLLSALKLRAKPPLYAFGDRSPAIAEVVSAEESARREGLPAGWLHDYGASVPASHRAVTDRFVLAGIRRSVGEVGRVGTRSWVVLMQGRDEGEPLVLQVKEARSSVLRPYLGPSVYAEHGRRVVEGQRLMQAVDDLFLGWFSGTGPDGVRRAFYVRRLWDAGGSVDMEHLPGSRFTAYAEVCGVALARAHARSGDPIAISAYLGGGDAFDQAVATFADAYADTNAADHGLLRCAAEAGVIEVPCDLTVGRDRGAPARSLPAGRAPREATRP
jgi:hypothetical protein